MAEAVAQAEDAFPVAAAAPYPRSWVNALNDWLEDLPGPTWLAYLVLATGAVVLQFAGLALLPGPQALDLVPVLYYGALPIAVLALIAVLDRTAGRALETLRPLLRLSDDDIAAVRRDLTVAPARPALVITILSVGITPIGYVLDPVGAGVDGYSPAAIALRWAWEAFVTATFLILIYHTYRQLRRIGRLHESIEAIDLFDQARLYALSSITSLTAIGLVLLLVPSVFLIPSEAGSTFLVISAAWYAFALAVAVTAFFVPLRGVHGRISSDKARALGEVGRRMSAAISAMNRAVDAGDADGVGSAQQALGALTAQRDLIARLPTWPWSTAALTRFLSAVLLPIGLWLITRVLERIV